MRLHERLSTADAIAAVAPRAPSSPRRPEGLGVRERCGRTILEVEDTLCAFVILDGASRFTTREDVRWTPPPAHVAQAAAVVSERRPFRLHVRRPDDLAWTLVDAAARIDMYGSLDGTGWSASFHLSTAIPRDLVGPLGAPPAPPAPLVGAALIDALASSTDGIALARAFHAGWFASTTTGEHAPASRPIAADGAPAAVRRWHALCDELHGPHRCAVACQPTEWRRDDELWFFQREEQAVVRWAVRAEQVHLDDPPVVIELDDEVEELSPSVSQFAVHLVLVYAVVVGGTGVHGFTDGTTGALARLPTIARPLPLPPWPWPAAPTTLWTTEGALLADCGGQLHLLTPGDESFALTARDLGLEPSAFDPTRY